MQTEVKHENGIIERYNGPRGHAFMQAGIAIEQEAKSRLQLFNQFIEERGYVAFHIEDGYVKRKDGMATINWVPYHAPNSHTARCPKIGEKMVIANVPLIKGFGDKFRMYSYKVVDKPKWNNFEIVVLEGITYEDIVFKDGVFKEAEPPKTLFQLFLDIFKF